jgi:predicted DNA-binding transcriptional regulator YafY
MSQTLICQAIDEKRVVSFYYGGSRPSERQVEPHTLGYDKDGDPILCGWQLSGGSRIGWRDFHVSKLSGLSITRQTFPAARPGYNPNDTTMLRVLCRL